MVIRNRTPWVGLALLTVIGAAGCGLGADKEENRKSYIKFRPAPPTSVTGSPQPEPPAAPNDLCLVSKQGSELDFGQVEVGAQSTRSVTLTNTCGHGVAISKVSLSGASHEAFSVTSRLEALEELGPGGSATIELRFEPQERGELEGELFVHTISAAGDGILTISLRGSCESP